MIIGRFKFDSNELVELELEPNQVQATKDVNGALLFFHFRLHLHSPAKRGLNADVVVYTLLTGDVCLDHVPEVSRLRIGSIEPIQVNDLHRKEWDGVRTFSSTAVMPFSERAMEAVERTRRGDIYLHLDWKLGVITYGPEMHALQKPPAAQPAISGAKSMVCQAGLLLPQSVWVNQVLNGSGYGQVKVVELPVLERSEHPGLEKSYQALDQALDYYRRGDYDTAVRDCRIALEAHWQRLKEKRRPDGTPGKSKLAEEWAEVVGASTVKWLQEVLGASWQATHKRHHSPNSGHYSRQDAQMIIAVTTAVLSYIARIDPPYQPIQG